MCIRVLLSLNKEICTRQQRHHVHVNVDSPPKCCDTPKQLITGPVACCLQSGFWPSSFRAYLSSLLIHHSITLRNWREENFFCPLKPTRPSSSYRVRRRQRGAHPAISHSQRTQRVILLLHAISTKFGGAMSAQK